MPKVHFVKKARKDNPVAKVGESYFWWKPWGSSKRYSKTRPTRSQLTLSWFLSELYEIEDCMERVGYMEPDDIEELISQLGSLQDQCQDNLDNMPYYLQETSESGTLLTQRVELLGDWIMELEDLKEDDEMSPEERATRAIEANPGID